MKIFLWIVLLSLSVTEGIAQVPGYMGKKLATYYSISLFPSINSGSHKPGINLRNDFALDYTVSKSVAVGVSFKYLTTSLKDVNYYTDNSALPVQKAFSGDVSLHGPAFSVYIKKFAFLKKGYIAPVGFYNKFEFCYGSYNATTDERNNPVAPEDFNYVNDFENLGFQSSFHTTGFIYSFGRQSLYFDKLFVTTGGSFSLMFPAYAGSVDFFTGTETTYISAAQTRMFGYFIFNIHLGIGFLAI